MKRLLAILLMLTSLGFAADCSQPLQHAVISITSATDTTLVTAQPGRKIIAVAFVIENNHASTDATITLKDGSTAMNGGQLIKAGGGSWTHTCALPPYDTSAGNALVATTDAAGTLKGTLWYVIQ